MYDCTLGRFLQRDPIAFPGVGLYAYAFDEPPRYLDSSGREVTNDPKLDYEYWDERMFFLAGRALKRAKADTAPGEVVPITLLRKLAALENVDVQVHYIDKIGDGGDMALQFAKDVANRARTQEGGVYLYFGHGTGTGGITPTIDKQSLKEFTEALAALNSDKRGIGLLCCHAGSYLQGIPAKAQMSTPLTETGAIYSNDAAKYCKENERNIIEWITTVLRRNKPTKDRKFKIHLYFGAMGDMYERTREKYKDSPKERPVYRNWAELGLKPR